MIALPANQREANMGLKRAFPIAVMFGILAIFFYEWSNPRFELFRYKLTINVRVDGTPYSASSVIEARQEVNSCPWWGFSGSGASGGCLPLFSAKGVAPMITLPDGAVIFASLSGNSSDKPPGVKGTGVARLPWLVYVPDWRAVADTSGKNWSIVPLPEEPPRIEIPFAGAPLSKFRPAMRWVPDQELGPADTLSIGPGVAAKYTGQDIKLTSFAIEPTIDALTEWLDPAPPWLAGYRGGKGYSAEESEQRRWQRIRGQSKFGVVGRREIETSKKVQ